MKPAFQIHTRPNTRQEQVYLFSHEMASGYAIKESHFRHRAYVPGKFVVYGKTKDRAVANAKIKCYDLDLDFDRNTVINEQIKIWN